MFGTRLSPSVVRELRAKACLSQAAVARATGINRSYLSLFEGCRYVLPDSDLETLEEFFFGLDSTSLETEAAKASKKPALSSARPIETVPAPSEQVVNGPAPKRSAMDGFDYAEAWSRDAVEKLLQQYHENEQKLGGLLDSEYRLGFFDEESESEIAAKTLLAQNALFIRALRGLDVPLSTARGAKTVGGALLAKLKIEIPEFATVIG